MSGNKVNTSIAVHTATSGSLNRGGGLSEKKHSSADRDSIKTKLYRY